MPGDNLTGTNVVPSPPSTVRPATIQLGLLGSIPEFQGTKFLEFEHAVTTAKLLGQWGDPQTVQAINLKVRGEALSFLLSDPACIVAKTATELLKALKTRYGRKDLPAMALTELITSTYQKQGEPVRAYSARVREIIARATPVIEGVNPASALLLLDDTGRIAFLKGLLPSIRRFATSSAPKTFDLAVDAAEREELYTLHYGEPANPHINTQMAALYVGQGLDSASVAAAGFQQRQSRFQHHRQGPPSRNMTQRRCFKCNKPGHFARDCYNRQTHSRSCFKCGSNEHLIAECNMVQVQQDVRAGSSQQHQSRNGRHNQGSRSRSNSRQGRSRARSPFPQEQLNHGNQESTTAEPQPPLDFTNPAFW